MADTFPYKALSAEKLADLFFQLAQLEKAGLPADNAFALLADNDANLKQRLQAVLRHIKAGKSIAEAGFREGLFNQIQRTLFAMAEASGTLAEIYKRLADDYAVRAKRLRKIKSRCYYPAIVLAISLFLQPLPALIAGSINEFQYLQLSFGRLIIIAFSVYFVLKLPSLLNFLGLKTVIDKLQLQLPLVSDWVVNRQLNDFYLNLSLLLAAGLSFAEALPKVVASIPNSVLQSQFKSALKRSSAGESVTEVLSMVDCIYGTTVIQIINSSEQSGSLAEGLGHFAQIEADNLHLQDDMLAEWLPRLVYAGVVIWVALSLIGF